MPFVRLPRRPVFPAGPVAGFSDPALNHEPVPNRAALRLGGTGVSSAAIATVGDGDLHRLEARWRDA